jgi:hypothetical protein
MEDKELNILFSSEVQPLRHPAAPPFHSVLLLLQTTLGQEKSHREVVCSPTCRQSEFQSLSGPGGCIECRGWQVFSGLLSWTSQVDNRLCSVLGNFPKPWHSITHQANTGGGKFRPGKWEVKNWADPGSWQSSQTQVQLGFKKIASDRFISSSPWKH